MRVRLRRKTKRFLGRLILASPLFLIGWLLYLLFRSASSAPPENITVEMSPARVERGHYLFESICACGSCHSQRDYKKFGAPVKDTGIGRGQEMPFNGLPGAITAQNLTPDKETGLGDWTDGEKIRAIREGISKDGRALYSLMPYQYYRFLSDEDVEALVAYMDSLPAIKNPLPRTRVSFPTTVWLKSVPVPVFHVAAADPDGGEAYGEYLVRIAACESCHTPRSGFQPDLQKRFAGGVETDSFFGSSISANITSDMGTGIGSWVYLQFEQRMRAYARYEGKPPDVAPSDFTLMPWENYAKIDDHDMEVMFEYLRGVKPVSNSTAGGKIFPGLKPLPDPPKPGAADSGNANPSGKPSAGSATSRPGASKQTPAPPRR
jgi:mono/diheme cytochrome c family protein